MENKKNKIASDPAICLQETMPIYKQLAESGLVTNLSGSILVQHGRDQKKMG